MKEPLRQAVRLRDQYHCCYYDVTETDIGSTLTIDHIQPPGQGGDDRLENLVYCCHLCNEFKGEYWKTEPDLRLLNPLVHDRTEHFRLQEDGTLLALTQRGANHIEVLHLNRPRLVEHRVRVRFYQTREVNHLATEARAAAMEEELRGLRRQRNRRQRRRRT